MKKAPAPITGQLAHSLKDSLQELGKDGSYKMIDGLPDLAKLVQPGTLSDTLGFSEADVRDAGTGPMSADLGRQAKEMYRLLDALVDARTSPTEVDPAAYAQAKRSLDILRRTLTEKSRDNGLYGLLVHDMDIGEAIALSSEPITPKQASMLLSMKSETSLLQ